MGGLESRCSAEERREEEAGLQSEARREEDGGGGGEEVQTPPPSEETDPPAELLEFAERMSQEVVAQALRLCWEAQIGYQELPFMDTRSEYVI